MLRAFIGFLQSLDKRVLLILDTCEELTKLPPVGEIIPNLQATFQIMEWIHEAVPDLRVIFSGRRLLALSGYGWQAVDPDLSQSEGKHRCLPVEKSYLRLYEVRGFGDDSPSEVERFFADKKKLRLSPAMRQAILAHSPEGGRAAKLDYTPPRPAEKGQRYNPFDLDLYANWVAQDSSLTPETLGTGGADPYVAMRIIHRIKDPEVRDIAIPAAVLLRRFDREMLRPALDVDEDRFEEIYQQLGDQEWTDTQQDATLRTTFLEIDRRLCPRLQAYFDRSGFPWPQITQRLAPALRVSPIVHWSC